MRTMTGISMQPGVLSGTEGLKGKPDQKVIAKQVETVFLNELLKLIMEQSSLGKDKNFSNYLPFVTAEMSKDLAEKGIGVGDFFLRGTSMTRLTTEKKPEVNDLPSSGKSNTPPEILQWNGALQLPVSGKISSKYGLRHDPIDGRLRKHNGIDIAIPEKTPVMPAAPGKVVFSGFSNGYGNYVVVEHENGLASIYGHNSVNLVKAGDVVDEHTVMALSGSTGKSTGPHLHFEVRKGGVPVDPEAQTG